MKVVRSRPVLFEELKHGLNISTKGLANFVGVKECLLLASAYTDYYSHFDGFRLSDRTAQTRRANPGHDCVSSNL